MRGNTEFAFDLYAKLRSREGNLFFSPFSISMALAMTYAGARGETAEQMATTLHLSGEGDSVHPAFAQLIGMLNAGADEYQLSVANALWGQTGYGFLTEFLHLLADCYEAGLQQVDFIGATELARQTINAWVEEHTEGKIKDLIPPGVLDDLTRLVLTNAIYFKANWVFQFDEERTALAPFCTGPDSAVEAPLMRISAPYKYLQTTALQVLELPYDGDDLSMLILLPSECNALGQVEESLTSGNVAQWLSQLQMTQVDVLLPRFKATATFDLKGPLSEMGMPLAFTEWADFSGMNGCYDLFVHAVLHKAYVDVNEQGTEAAGATGVVVGPVSVGPIFRADHPFVFLIRDSRSGSILFIGRLVNPLEEGE